MSTILDTKGFNCPIPVLKARRAMRGLDVGDELTLLATDPASMIDVPHFCNTTGHELVDSSEEDGVFTYRIRKADV
ncbi:MAG: sulfurtransferase TusA family protein [Rhodospirillaceae bacterium]|nr:sulfurtransferase TusA family protein [Rhodospirillaceae bacterium]MDD9917151.1 sulfurtransferase TusA family protein [Rhodospirillaceae bacterium]MDD9924970.1 sulfurtransferase TusA family protein [Rhodospirillaceae bacterium]